jgi:hypothetical protein
MDIKKFTDLLKLTTPYADDVTGKVVKSDEEDVTEDTDKRVKQVPQEELFNWNVTIAPYKMPKRIIRSAMVFVILFVIFLILVRDWMFLFLILGFAFLFNLIVNSPAKKIEYKIFSNGFEYDGMFFGWDEFNHFFFYEDNPNLIIITTKDTIPGRVYVYVDDTNKLKIDEMLNRYLDKKNFHPKDFFEIIIFKLKPYLNLTDEK